MAQPGVLLPGAACLLRSRRRSPSSRALQHGRGKGQAADGCTALLGTTRASGAAASPCSPHNTGQSSAAGVSQTSPAAGSNREVSGACGQAACGQAQCRSRRCRCSHYGQRRCRPRHALSHAARTTTGADPGTRCLTQHSPQPSGLLCAGHMRVPHPRAPPAAVPLPAVLHLLLILARQPLPAG